MVLTLGIPVRVLQAGAFVVLASVVGLIAGMQPVLALGAAVGIAFVALVLSSFAVGLCLFALVTFLEAFPAAGGLSFSKAVGILLIISWLAAAVVHRSGEHRDLLARYPAFAGLLVVFLAWAAASLVWAESVDAASTDVVRFALNLALFPIVFAALRAPQHAVWLYVVLIVGALLSVAYGLVLPTGDENRLTGAGLNPNQLGGLLVVGTVLAAALAASRWWSPAGSLLAVVAAVACAAGLFLTVSRGALLGFAAALLVAPIFAGRGRRLAAFGLVALGVVTAVTWFGMVAPASAIERITQTDTDGSGRSDIWTVGWRMVEDQPLRGVGVGNFPTSSVNYLLQPGTIEQGELIVDQPKVAHNIYLHVLAELGVVGFALFCAILLYALYCSLHAARLFARRSDRTMEILSRGLFVALIGLLAADFFSSQLYAKQLWLLLATAPALRAIAERSTEAEPT